MKSMSSNNLWQKKPERTRKKYSFNYLSKFHNYKI